MMVGFASCLGVICLESVSNDSPYPAGQVTLRLDTVIRYPYHFLVIRSFADDTTADLFNGVNSRAAREIDRRIWSVARRKLDAINAAVELRDLRQPPGNRLEALEGNQAGRYSIRVNDQYRITFTFADGHADAVRCEDYH